eukprot:COSAG01_NODE_12543_length_1722_cov_16.091189_1_plen_27_part_10
MSDNLRIDYHTHGGGRSALGFFDSLLP